VLRRVRPETSPPAVSQLSSDSKFVARHRVACVKNQPDAARRGARAAEPPVSIPDLPAGNDPARCPAVRGVDVTRSQAAALDPERGRPPLVHLERGAWPQGRSSSRRRTAPSPRPRAPAAHLDRQVVPGAPRSRTARPRTGSAGARRSAPMSPASVDHRVHKWSRVLVPAPRRAGAPGAGEGASSPPGPPAEVPASTTFPEARQAAPAPAAQACCRTVALLLVKVIKDRTKLAA